MPELLLTMKGITKRYGGIRALEQVDFELEKGELLCLLGENGAGKSTLMKILSGAYTADENGNFSSFRNAPTLFCNRNGKIERQK